MGHDGVLLPPNAIQSRYLMPGLVNDDLGLDTNSLSVPNARYFRTVGCHSREVRTHFKMNAVKQGSRLKEPRYLEPPLQPHHINKKVQEKTMIETHEIFRYARPARNQTMTSSAEKKIGNGGDLKGICGVVTMSSRWRRRLKKPGKPVAEDEEEERKNKRNEAEEESRRNRKIIWGRNEYTEKIEGKVEIGSDSADDYEISFKGE
ncbi:hypothetical protein RUM44_002293 [Polyplax serrata]|uniref:Uncharacterized protein n=1 Tax=Polyplax serrata TaxID=468196 RepID=A0ABR1AMI0_POLSC